MDIKFGNYSIRPYRNNDLEDLQKHANNMKIWQNLRDRFPHPYKIEDAQNWINIVSARQQGEVGAICQEDRFIGTIGIEFGSDIHAYSAELGYWLGEPYWGRGIMAQAIKLYTDYVIERFKLIRVYAIPFEENKASSRVLENAGFKYEGLLRLSAVKQGRAQNTLMFAKIDEERAASIGKTSG